uniref:Uncharacterized protein n=1 Tax=Panagrolaimus sp. ES5 TaxID=591445 RepID=A0AC34GQ99_9BILA
MLKPKSLLQLSFGQISEPQRNHLTSAGIKWLFVALVAFVDFSLDFALLRFFTAYCIPYVACYGISCCIMLLGFFNAITCTLAAFDFNAFTNFGVPNSLHHSMANQKSVVQKKDYLPDIVANLLDESFFHVQSDYVPPTLKDYYSSKKHSDLKIIRKTLIPSSLDIYTDEQLVKLSKMETAHAYTLFEPKYNKYINYEYHQSADVEEDEDQNLNSLNRSQLDLLDISDHYANHPDEHPLEPAKRKTLSLSASSTGFKRGKSPAPVSETGSRLSSSYHLHTLPRNAPMTRSPKFLMAQKPTLTPITKVFAQWKVDGNSLITMTENIRKFLSLHIIHPLAKEINKINAFFLTIPRTRNMSIGKTPIPDIEKIFGQIQDNKVVANLPYVLAFLRLHPNYVHFVKRILTWARSDYIFDYCPDATTQLSTSWPEIFPASKTLLPTDSELIFRLFCFYMDTQCGLYPITFPYPCDLPFTHIHTLQEGKKPSDAQLSASGYYVEISDAQPITFKFNASRYPAIVTPATPNALITILMLLVYGHGCEWYDVLSRTGGHY